MICTQFKIQHSLLTTGALLLVMGCSQSMSRDQALSQSAFQPSDGDAPRKSEPRAPKADSSESQTHETASQLPKNPETSEIPRGEVPEEFPIPAPEETPIPEEVEIPIKPVCDAEKAQVRGTTLLSVNANKGFEVVAYVGTDGGFRYVEKGKKIYQFKDSNGSLIRSTLKYEKITLPGLVDAIQQYVSKAGAEGTRATLQVFFGDSIKNPNWVRDLEACDNPDCYRVPGLLSSHPRLTLTHVDQLLTKREFPNAAVLILAGQPGEVPEGNPTTEETCTEQSPLMVDMSGDGISLSLPSDGVSFDILGKGSVHRISWPKHSDDMFISRPIRNRVTRELEVTSIHELFGNNTRGPDGKSASNGYEALRKFDSNRDGKIDRYDRVFSELYLWSDSNRNGRSDDGELSSLSRSGIVHIELRAISTPEDGDDFGNKSKQRSAVARYNRQFNTLEYVPSYDMWFIPFSAKQ